MSPTPSDQNPDAAMLVEFDAEAVAECRLERGEHTLVVPSGKIRWVCQLLKARRAYLFLADITAVDWFTSEPRFQIVYHLLCPQRKQRLRLKCRVSSDAAEIDSVSSVWRAANWHEREVFDLFGIRFRGHPDLRRILMPDDWEGYPLRRDYPVTGHR